MLKSECSVYMLEKKHLLFSCFSADLPVLTLGNLANFQWKTVADFAACQTQCNASPTCQFLAFLNVAANNCLLSPSDFASLRGNKGSVQRGRKSV